MQAESAEDRTRAEATPQRLLPVRINRCLPLDRTLQSRKGLKRPRAPRPEAPSFMANSYALGMKRRVLFALALVVATAGVITAIALPSIDPCRVGDQVIPGCPLLTPTFDRIGLRLTIGGVGILAGAALFLWASRRGNRTEAAPGATP